MQFEKDAPYDPLGRPAAAGEPTMSLRILLAVIFLLLVALLTASALLAIWGQG